MGNSNCSDQQERLIRMKLIVLTYAEDEFINAVRYYEDLEKELGSKFSSEVSSYIEWIRSNYNLPSLRKGGYRRVNLRVFPYFISYIIRGQTIWILAIAHVHRKPLFWRDRISKITNLHE